MMGSLGLDSSVSCHSPHAQARVVGKPLHARGPPPGHPAGRSPAQHGYSYSYSMGGGTVIVAVVIMGVVMVMIQVKALIVVGGGYGYDSG